ncbi:MAG TPA: nucleotide-binding protein [Thermoanaerobaculia bacterium]|nr:nucleotide-binding protein [Thermoanaerobaculia bacterium]
MTDWRSYVDHFYRQSAEEQHRLWSKLTSDQQAAFLEARAAKFALPQSPPAELVHASESSDNHSMTLIEEIDVLIRLGHDLKSAISNVWGTNKKRAHEYIAWRLRCITVLREMGPRAEHLLPTIEKRRAMYNGAFLDEILGAMVAARGLSGRMPIVARSEESTAHDDHHNGKSSVFIVHGHDNAILQQAARLLEQLELDPIILFEEVSKGRTIMEKLEQRSKASAALVLLTPDDVGGSVAEVPRQLKPRSRQNVILELGYFLGLLGRTRVVVLYTPGIELPSDFVGVEYIKLDSEGAWRLRVARELRAANLDINLNNLS